jgi:cytochrome c oxidase accessory protein FixG
VFRAPRPPTAADNRLQAHGTITFAGAGVSAEPLPKFAPEQLGDCIDCTICVQVCPTGIDIRNGLQYECIACGACIDACDEVMDKMGYPQGLIRYSTQNAIDGKPTRVLRPRVIVYGLLLLGLLLAWGWGVTHRSELIAEVLRDRNALYRQTAQGTVENDYTLKLINKDNSSHRYRIELQSGTAGIALREAPVIVQAGPEQVLSLPLTVTAPASLGGRHALRFQIQRIDGQAQASIDSSFFGPLK